MFVTRYVVGQKRNGKQERETWWWEETVEFISKSQKKTMEGVADRRQQRKIFGGKKESKIMCLCC